ARRRRERSPQIDWRQGRRNADQAHPQRRRQGLQDDLQADDRREAQRRREGALEVRVQEGPARARHARRVPLLAGEKARVARGQVEAVTALHTAPCGWSARSRRVFFGGILQGFEEQRLTAHPGPRYVPCVFSVLEEYRCAATSSL